MGDIFEDGVEPIKTWDEFTAAVWAVLDRSVTKNDLYQNVVCDQLLYVAGCIILDQANDPEGVAIDGWSADRIRDLEKLFQRRSALLDKLLKEQEESK